MTAVRKSATSHSWTSHLRGHLLLFDPRPAPGCPDHIGARLLLAAALVEGVRIASVRWVYPGIPQWLLLPVLLGFALLAVPSVTGLTLSHLGFRPWRGWTITERSYFVQVLVLANLVFPLVLGMTFRNRPASPGIGSSLWVVFVPYLFFGFYQELVYRGMVQLALVSRWGALGGILGANVLYSFGPLHWYYFASPASLAWPMFTSIFLIGLFFGVLYQRTGNLWIVAVFHAIGNAYIVWHLGSLQ